MVDEYKKKNSLLNEDDQDTDSGESGGQGSQVAFTDFTNMSGGHTRDDLLPDEKKRLLWMHGEVNEASIKKQKAKREQYKALKEGKVTLAAHRQGVLEAGLNSQFKPNPILAKARQFVGIDKQVNPLINEFIADTNEALRNELEQKLQLQQRLENRPRPTSTPKPSPFSS